MIIIEKYGKTFLVKNVANVCKCKSYKLLSFAKFIRVTNE